MGRLHELMLQPEHHARLFDQIGQVSIVGYEDGKWLEVELACQAHILDRWLRLLAFVVASPWDPGWYEVKHVVQVDDPPDGSVRYRLHAPFHFRLAIRDPRAPEPQKITLVAGELYQRILPLAGSE